MKRWISGVFAAVVLLMSAGCAPTEQIPRIVATTMPVYTFTSALCEGTPLQVNQLVQENVSCLHDYTLTVKHMKLLEGADLVVISGAGLENFLEDALPESKMVLDASGMIDLHCADQMHSHDDHHHETDPHYWLSITNAKRMASTICDGLKAAYPQYCETFQNNLTDLDGNLTAIHDYAASALADLSSREIVTFHDGFSYMAEEFQLTILKSIEEESGSEASAKDLIQICDLVANHALPAVFVEKNGSSRSANVICKETGAMLFYLDMAMSGGNYFDAMYHNINTLKEALE